MLPHPNRLPGRGLRDVIRLPGRALATRLRRRALGQSLVELAITLPILLLLLGGAIDLGRAFYAGVAVENSAKEGVLFGSPDPACETSGTGCADPANVEWHIRKELSGMDASWAAECVRAGSVIPSASCTEGDMYRVTVEHEFALVTPLLSAIFGDGVTLASTETAVVFAGSVAGGPLPVPLPSDPAEEDPPGMCLVPNLIGLKANKTDAPWDGRGFTGPITKSGTGNFTVAGQSLQSGTWWPCTSGITISVSPISPSPAPTPLPTPTAEPTPSPGEPTPEPTPTPLPTPSATPDCRLVPTLEGFTVAQARTKWTDAGFTGAFNPATGQNNKNVVTQTTNPPSLPGDCLPASATVTVTHEK